MPAGIVKLLTSQKKKKTWFWMNTAECAIAYNVQHNMQSIRVTRGQPALAHFVLTAEAACKLPWKKEVYVVRISRSRLFNFMS